MRDRSVCPPRFSGTSFGFSQSGYRTQSKDAGGGISTYSYDAQGNLASKSFSKGSRSGPATGYDTWTYTHNSFGEVLTATDSLASQPGDPNHTTTNAYDTHGNLLSVTTPSPDGSTPASVTSSPTTPTVRSPPSPARSAM